MTEAREDSSILTLVRAAPRRIGRYDICFEIAAGGMATIYLARVEGPGGFKKLVALKCIHPHLVRQSGFVEMFLDEARLASRISHPNVCTVFDFGFADSTYYIAMEFLVGETVGRLCRLAQQHPERSPMPAHAGYASRIIADAAEGLHAAHDLTGDDGLRLNVVHRDVSPANVMVTYDGAVKVMDFGIARTMDQLHLTRTGTVRGKFPYMAPEQVEQGAIDRRTDVWALGVVFWELLAGQRLFHRERELDSIRAVLQAPIPAPSSVRAGVPRELDEIVMHALQRDPARRFSSARELATAIENTRGKRDAVVGHGVVAAWLRQLFPDLYARRLELVDQARQMSESSIPRISRALSEPSLDTRPLEEPVLAAGAREPWSKTAWLSALAALGLALAALAFWLWPASPQGEPAPVVARPASEPVKALPVTAPEATSEVEAPGRPGPKPEGRASLDGEGTAQPQRSVARGFVNVATPGGWADVFVAGRHRGRTPLQLELPEGRRTVVLRAFGKRSIQRSVLVRPRQVTRLVVPVTP